MLLFHVNLTSYLCLNCAVSEKRDSRVLTFDKVLYYLSIDAVAIISLNFRAIWISKRVKDV